MSLRWPLRCPQGPPFTQRLRLPGPTSKNMCYLLTIQRRPLFSFFSFLKYFCQCCHRTKSTENEATGALVSAHFAGLLVEVSGCGQRGRPLVCVLWLRPPEGGFRSRGPGGAPASPCSAFQGRCGGSFLLGTRLSHNLGQNWCWRPWPAAPTLLSLSSCPRRFKSAQERPCHHGHLLALPPNSHRPSPHCWTATPCPSESPGWGRSWVCEPGPRGLPPWQWRPTPHTVTAFGTATLPSPRGLGLFLASPLLPCPPLG